MPSKTAFQRNSVMTPLTTVTSITTYPMYTMYYYISSVLVRCGCSSHTIAASCPGELWQVSYLWWGLVYARRTSPALLAVFNPSIPYPFPQPRGQMQHKRIVNLSISGILRYRDRLWSCRPLRNSIMSCSVFAVALENLWILLLKICLKKKIFLMK